MRSIDKTNFRFGRRTLSIASAGIRKKWFMKRVLRLLEEQFQNIENNLTFQ